MHVKFGMQIEQFIPTKSDEVFLYVQNWRHGGTMQKTQIKESRYQ